MIEIEQKWRPIHTAPDGVPVLTYSPNGLRNPMNGIQVNYFLDGGWQRTGAEFCAPTHWMPLPKIPR